MVDPYSIASCVLIAKFPWEDIVPKKNVCYVVIIAIRIYESIINSARDNTSSVTQSDKR